MYVGFCVRSMKERRSFPASLISKYKSTMIFEIMYQKRCSLKQSEKDRGQQPSPDEVDSLAMADHLEVSRLGKVEKSPTVEFPRWKERRNERPSG